VPNFKEMVRSAWDAAWNKGDADALDTIVHPDYALENQGLGRSEGISDLKTQILDMRAAMPDMRTNVDKIVVDGDDFAIFWSATGTFTHAFGDVPPNGRSLQSRGAVQGELKNGLIVREKVSWDPSVEMLSDLGAPSIGSAFEGDVSLAAGSEDGLSPEDLKEFNRKFVSGVTAVTVKDASGKARGLAVSAYMLLDVT